MRRFIPQPPPRIFALTILVIAASVSPWARYEPPVAAQAPSARQVVAFDATATFLRTAPIDTATRATIISLATSGLAPGDELRLSYEVNNFKYGSFCDPTAPNVAAPGVFALGLFSRSSQLEGTGVLRRVPDAIDTGLRHFTSPNDDIAEDFRISPTGLTIKIPAGATHLFLGIADSFYADNCGQINVTIEQTGTQATCRLAGEMDATATFLRTAPIDSPTRATIIPLAARGFAPGDELRLSYEVSNFKYGSFCDPTAPNVAAPGVFVLGLFSRSDRIESQNTPQRVPDAVDAGLRHFTAPNDDIAEDFRIAPTGLTVKIPVGATHLLLGIADSFYADNCGRINVTIDRVVTQLTIPATTHGFSGDIFTLAQSFPLALTSTPPSGPTTGIATGLNFFSINATNFGGNITEIGGLAGFQPQGLAFSTPGGRVTGLSCLDSVWDFTFVLAGAGNTVGDTVSFFLQNPDGSGLLTLAVFTIEAGGARVTALHPSARFYVNNRLANIPPASLNTFLPFTQSAGNAGMRTVPLLMSLPMDPGSIFNECRQLGLSLTRGSGAGTLSLVVTDIVLVRQEVAGDRNRPGTGLIFGTGGGFPTGAMCAVNCPACLMPPTASQ